MAGKSMKVGGGGRFQKLKKELAKKGVDNPSALAASIGRKKYGAKKFQAMATKCMWWMPWRSQAMKDVQACEKQRGAGNGALIR